jgi:hypothetical protein
MIFFFSCDFVCSLRLLIVNLLTLLLLLNLTVSVAPRYIPSTASTMPVTTRSQSKRLQNDTRVHSFSTTLGSPLSLVASTTTTECNLTTTTSVMVPTCNTTTATSLNTGLSTTLLHDHDTNILQHHLLDSPLSSKFSKFRKFEISKFQIPLHLTQAYSVCLVIILIF